MSYNIFGGVIMRIKELREEMNFSQDYIAKAVGTSQRNISRWEKGENEPSYKQLVSLADFFNCSIDYLVGRTDDFGVVNVAPISAELSADEIEIIKRYRSLSLFQQEAIRMQLDALAEKTKKQPL